MYCFLCSGAEIGRFVTMLRNPDSTLKACAAFALLQVCKNVKTNCVVFSCWLTTDAHFFLFFLSFSLQYRVVVMQCIT